MHSFRNVFNVSWLGVTGFVYINVFQIMVTCVVHMLFTYVHPMHFTTFIFGETLKKKNNNNNNTIPQNKTKQNKKPIK